MSRAPSRIGVRALRLVFRHPGKLETLRRIDATTPLYPGLRRHAESADGVAAAALPEQCDLRGIATKGGDVLFQPLQCDDGVVDALHLAGRSNRRAPSD